MTDTSVERPDLSLVLERITDGFFALDAQWRFSYMNAEARRLLHAQEDCIGAFWLDAFPKARGRLFEREYHRAMRDQIVVQFVEYSRTANRWFEVKAYPSTDGLSVYFRDVSSRVDAEREIERAARRQQALIDFGRFALASGNYDRIIASALNLIRDVVETPIVEVHDYERLAERFSVRQVVGWGVHAQLDCARPLLEHVRHVVDTGEPFVCSDVRIDPRARSLASLEAARVLSSVAVLIGTPQQPLGAIVAYCPLTRAFSVNDVRFMQSLAQTIAENATTLESARRMAQVLESIRDSFVAVDRDLRITYVNSQMAKYWQRPAAEMIGAPLAEFLGRMPDGERSMRYVREALTSGRSVTHETVTNGIWFEVRLYPFANGVAAYVRDITALKTEQQRILELNVELERRVAERTKQLELANAELESFSYSVSHDLRAPLRAIDGFSLALMEDYGPVLDERARGHLGRVRKAAQRMADLIDALLGLSKVARVSITLVPVDLTSDIEGIVADLRDQEPTRDVEVIVEPHLTALGEPRLVHVVLQNLLGNAWKFTRKVASARIEVGRTGDGGFSVRDNGAGFDMAYRNKLFGAFARLHSADDYEGTGIGLATVARIIHRHGGTIRAEGAIGNGATFYFTLPAGKD